MRSKWGDKMAKYSVGIETKEKILSVCKKLFYEYGFEGTSYKMICDMANINRGLLPYHFKSKSAIAQIIYNEFWDLYDSLIENEFSGYSIVFKTSIQEVLLFRCLCSNEKFLRFYMEMKSNSCFGAYSLDKQEKFIKRILDITHKEISQDEIVTLSCMFLGVENGLVYNVYSKKINEDEDNISKKDLQFVFSMLDYPLDIINEAYQEAVLMADKYGMSVADDFGVVLQSTS